MEGKARMIVAWFAVVVFAVVSLPGNAEAGAWVKKPGSTYAKLAGEIFSSKTNFDVEGHLMESMPDYSHFGARAYLELGLLPRVGIAAGTALLSAKNTLDDGRDFNRTGFGDLDVRLDAQIFRAGGCALAANMKGRIPLYSGMVQPGDQATAAMSKDSDDKFEPILGDGSYEFTPTAAFGCGFPGPGWATAHAGPNFRFDGFGNGLSYGVGAGFYVLPDRLAITANASGVQRFSDTNERPTKSYLNVGGGLIVGLFGNVSVEANAGYTPTGAFVARGWSGSLGFSYGGALFPNPFGK